MPYIEKYDRKGIEVPAVPKHWKKCEQNNKEITRNKLFAPHNTETIRAVQIGNNHKCKKQVILSLITDIIKQHYLAVSNLSVLLAKNNQIMMEIFIVQTALIHTPQRINLKNMKNM